MKRFRIGNDITITWDVLKGGSPAELSDKSVTIYLTNSKGREPIEHTLRGDNTIEIVFEGLKQTSLGPHTLTIDARIEEGGSRYMIQDKCGVFELVGRSCAENCEEIDYSITI